MKIVLSEYNSDWSGGFEDEKRVLLAAISSAEPVIEHVGSTAVPDLTAKPILDIMIGLADFGGANSLVPNIQQLGYTYFPQYENVMPRRRFFKKMVNHLATHHIHMVEIDSEFWVRHLLFRDFLRDNPVIALDYADLKCNLARREWVDGNAYADAKTDFIRGIEKQAGFLPESV